VVRRLESRATHAYAAVDLTPTVAHPQVLHVEREFVFVRELETLVVLDRIETRQASAVKTFLAHCETEPRLAPGGATCAGGGQALTLTTLVPSQPPYRVVPEGGRVGQYRIEVDAPGGPLSHILTVLRAHDVRKPVPAPALSEDARSLTVELERGLRLSFAKGRQSAGGSLTAAGVTAPLRADVQAIEVTDAGPAWR